MYRYIVHTLCRRVLSIWKYGNRHSNTSNKKVKKVLLASTHQRSFKRPINFKSSSMSCQDSSTTSQEKDMDDSDHRGQAQKQSAKSHQRNTENLHKKNRSNNDSFLILWNRSNQDFAQSTQVLKHLDHSPGLTLEACQRPTGLSVAGQSGAPLGWTSKRVQSEKKEMDQCCPNTVWPLHKWVLSFLLTWRRGKQYKLVISWWLEQESNLLLRQRSSSCVIVGN